MKEGIVKIHGREYKTVALRVSEFRAEYPIEKGWSISTELLYQDEAKVIVKAIVAHGNEPRGSGHAEEYRDASKINRTSALEVAETSAIGRALAAIGLAGTEYASANEVLTAIAAQDKIAALKDAVVTYAPEIALINNLEFDHADIFDDLRQVQASFGRLINLIPSNGLLVVNGDDENITPLSRGRAKIGTARRGCKDIFTSRHCEIAGHSATS